MRDPATPFLWCVLQALESKREAELAACAAREDAAGREEALVAARNELVRLKEFLQREQVGRQA